MSTITDIRTVGITTADQDKAIAFYRDTLDFVVRLDVDGPTRWTRHYVRVTPGGVRAAWMVPSIRVAASAASISPR